MTQVSVPLTEFQVVLDSRECDVHDRRVEHDHQLRKTHDSERQPPTSVVGVELGGGRENDVHSDSQVEAYRW